MGNGLDVLARGEFDLVALGALSHRLDPGMIPFPKATRATST